MFSKAEAQQIKKDFWVSFGKSFPKKWILYDTGIKDFAFKFYVDNKKAEVSLQIESKDEFFREYYGEKIESLSNLLEEEIGPYYFDNTFYLDNGKLITKAWVCLEGVSVFNKNDWSKIYDFFVEKMNGFERFYNDYKDFIKD